MFKVPFRLFQTCFLLPAKAACHRGEGIRLKSKLLIVLLAVLVLLISISLAFADVPAIGRTRVSSGWNAGYSLTNSSLAESINVIKNPMSLEELLQRNVIVELDYLSPSNKVFLTQSLLLWIYYHKLNLPRTEKLEQIIIIEEAQNLLLIGKEEMKSGNILPKIIREFRELGVGLIFIAQEISKMNTTALQNSYTLIALNQRYRKDIEVLGSSMSLRLP